MGRKAVIAGGGLAGLTCAKGLVDAGWDVTLLEGAPHLGGRAATHRDADGDWVEQGLHLVLGMFSELQALLRGVGCDLAEVLSWTPQLQVHDPEGPAEAVFGLGPARSPLKALAGLFGGSDYLGARDKLALLPLAAPALADYETLRARHDGETVTDWWGRTSGDEKLLERVLRPLCRALQFTEPEDFSAFNFLTWVHHATRDLPHAQLGSYRGARDTLVFQPIARYLRERGAQLRLGTRLEELQYRPGPGRLEGMAVQGGERLVADAYVCALPAWNLRPLLPAALKADPFFAGLDALPIAPAISVQLWLDREVVGHERFALVANSTACVFQDQSRCTYPDARGSRLSVLLSPADGLLGESDAELVRRTLRELGRVAPALREARVRKSLVLRHDRHLVRPKPGVMSRRPTQATPVPNLFLAGDWTEQPYFGSQEGAVRSGKAAAEAVLRVAEARRAS